MALPAVFLCSPKIAWIQSLRSPVFSLCSSYRRAERTRSVPGAWILARMAGHETAAVVRSNRDPQEIETLMTYVIAEPCIGTKDTACVDACAVDCIHPKKDETDFENVNQLYIDPVECIDCGACVPVSPVSAIFALDDLPEKWSHFTGMNAQYYKR